MDNVGGWIFLKISVVCFLPLSRWNSLNDFEGKSDQMLLPVT